MITFILWVLPVFLLVGCGGDGDPLSHSHTHTFTTTWVSSITEHWHQCYCGEKTDVAPPMMATLAPFVYMKTMADQVDSPLSGILQIAQPERCM